MTVSLGSISTKSSMVTRDVSTRVMMCADWVEFIEFAPHSRDVVTPKDHPVLSIPHAYSLLIWNVSQTEGRH